MSGMACESDAQRRLLEHLVGLVGYWEAIPGKTKGEALFGLVHSLLAVIDGEGSDMPAFSLSPMPSEDDKEWSESSGTELSGDLHDQWSAMRTRQ